jgi:hypothetical protein
MAELRIPIIGEFKGKKAFDQAGKASSTLDKSVKRLGASLLAAFSVQKITQFSKTAVKAFMEDEKAANRLAKSVENLGLAFATPHIENFIKQMADASGVTDDQLRPAMQRLLQTTGSLTKSTALMTQALDISRGSGVDYETVVNDLTMAYVGQTRGLRKYSLGLSQAELKAMSFADVQKKLTSRFSGANAAYLETYAGKMGILANAASESTEIIGKGLVDSLTMLAGEGNTVQPLADSMQDLAQGTSDVIVGLADIVSGFKNLGGLSDVKVGFAGNTIGDLFTPNLNMIPLVGPMLETLRLRGKKINTPGMGGYPSSALGPGYIDPSAAKQKKADADEVKRSKTLAALQKKSLDAQKKQNALTKASKTLDLDRISVTAALRGQISETDRLSLQLQLALLDKNESQALKLSAELTEAVKRQNDLKAALLATPEAPNPYRNWKPPTFVGPVMPPSVTAPITEPKFPYGEQVPNFNVPEYMKQGSAGFTGRPAGDYLGLSAIGAGATADTILNVVVKIGEEEVTGAITSVQQNQSLSGTFSDVNRYSGRGAPSIR